MVLPVSCCNTYLTVVAKSLLLDVGAWIILSREAWEYASFMVYVSGFGLGLGFPKSSMFFVVESRFVFVHGVAPEMPGVRVDMNYFGMRHLGDYFEYVCLPASFFFFVPVSFIAFFFFNSLLACLFFGPGVCCVE